MIVYKYVFITELEVPVFDELDIAITDDSFVLHLIPDDLKFEALRALDDAFDRFQITFLPNEYNLIKLNFRLCD